MFVIRRPAGWEIRESERTDRGPRSRTLATFKRLDDATIAHAAARASRPVDRSALIKSALRAGAPVDPAPADQHAEALLHELGRGRSPRPALRRLLEAKLGDGADRNPAAGLADWLGSSSADRGAALVDLLLLGDAIPVARQRAEPAFPGFHPK